MWKHPLPATGRGGERVCPQGRIPARLWGPSARASRAWRNSNAGAASHRTPQSQHERGPGVAPSHFSGDGERVDTTGSRSARRLATFSRACVVLRRGRAWPFLPSALRAPGLHIPHPPGLFTCRGVAPPERRQTPRLRSQAPASVRRRQGRKRRRSGGCDRSLSDAALSPRGRHSGGHALPAGNPSGTHQIPAAIGFRQVTLPAGNPSGGHALPAGNPSGTHASTACRHSGDHASMVSFFFSCE